MKSAEVIDLHAHLYPEGCFTEVIKDRSEFKLLDDQRGQSLLYRGSHVMSLPKDQADLNSRLASMDSVGIAMAILSVGALNVGWAGSREAPAARFVNDGLAAVCRQQPSRFKFVAVLPYTHRSEMIKELDRALALGAVGVGIATNVGDLELHVSELRDFWREMSRRKLTVLVHPTYPCDGPQNDPGTFLSVGYPGESAMAATKLALFGVLEECPDVNIVWSHLGGGLAMMLDRIDRGYQRYSSCPHPPSYYLRRCFYDTACTLGPALDCAWATFGASQLVFGSDEPHVPNASKDVVSTLRSRRWSVSDLQAVVRDNALRLLALERPI